MGQREAVFAKYYSNSIRGPPNKVVRLFGDFGHYSNTIREYYSNNRVLSILYTKSNVIPNN